MFIVQVTILTLAVVHLVSGNSSTEVSNRSRSRCRIPRKEQLLELLMNATFSDPPHDNTPRENPYWDNRMFNLCDEIAKQDWADERSRPLKLRSLCPWTLVTESRRHDRFPSRIAEARCVCRRCQMHGSTHQCAPIYHSMIVLLKTDECDERNFAIYKPARHLVVVGCTCVDASQS